MTTTKRARKVSNTNMVEKRPIARKAAAKGALGAFGAAMAKAIIAQAEETGKFLAKAGLTMKDRLRELAKGTREDHLEFRAALEARRKSIEDEAGKAKITLTAYRDADPVADSVYVTISLWVKLSKALESGWTPDYDKPWADISKAATAALDKAKAKAQQDQLAEQVRQNKIAAKQAAAAGDAKMAEVHEKKAELLQAEIKAAPQTAAPTTRTQQRGRPEKPLWDKVLEIIKDRPIHEVEKLTAQLVMYIGQQMNQPLGKTLESLRDSITKGQLPAGETAKTTTAAKSGAEKPGVSGEEVREPVEATRNYVEQDGPARKGRRTKGRK